MPTSDVELPIGPSIMATIRFPLGSGNPENTLLDQDAESPLWGSEIWHENRHLTFTKIPRVVLFVISATERCLVKH